MIDYIAAKSEEIANHYYAMEELTYELRNHIDTLQFDPERLNEIESRLNEINRLKRKYGQSVNDIIEYMATIEEEIEQITIRIPIYTLCTNKLRNQKDSRCLKLAPT